MRGGAYDCGCGAGGAVCRWQDLVVVTCATAVGNNQYAARCATIPTPTRQSLPIAARTQVHSTSSYALGLGQALGERAYLRKSAPSLKANAATRMLGVAAATAACTAVTASTDTHIPEAALSCCHQAMLVSSHIGRRRTALELRAKVGWLGGEQRLGRERLGRVPLSGPAERSAVASSSSVGGTAGDRSAAGDRSPQPCERSSATVVTCLGRL